MACLLVGCELVKPGWMGLDAMCMVMAFEKCSPYPPPSMGESMLQPVCCVAAEASTFGGGRHSKYGSCNLVALVVLGADTSLLLMRPLQ